MPTIPTFGPSLGAAVMTQDFTRSAAALQVAMLFASENQGNVRFGPATEERRAFVGLCARGRVGLRSGLLRAQKGSCEKSCCRGHADERHRQRGQFKRGRIGRGARSARGGRLLDSVLVVLFHTEASLWLRAQPEPATVLLSLKVRPSPRRLRAINTCRWFIHYWTM